MKESNGLNSQRYQTVRNRKKKEKRAEGEHREMEKLPDFKTQTSQKEKRRKTNEK